MTLRIDWKEIEEKYTPRARCVHCQFVKFKGEFSLQQYQKKDKRPFCKKCVGSYVEAGTPLECIVCNIWKGYEAFHERHHHFNALNIRTCRDCQEKRNGIFSDALRNES